MAQPRITYTSDEDLLEIITKDQNVEIIGYVFNITTPVEVGSGKKRYLLFKVLLSNGSSKITLLIWNKDLIDKYQPIMTMNKILHIEKATAKLANPNFVKDDNMIVHELVIGKETVVTILGDHDAGIVQQEQLPPTKVDFLGTIGFKGTVVIQGFVKTAFTVVTNKNGTSSWGGGAITDGTYKINVHIAQFVESNIPKGKKIELTGEIRSTEPPIIIHCANMTNIRVLEEEPVMPMEVLIRGVRTPRRPLQEKNDNKGNVEQSPKKMAFDGTETMDSEEK